MKKPDIKMALSMGRTCKQCFYFKLGVRNRNMCFDCNKMIRKELGRKPHYQTNGGIKPMSNKPSFQLTEEQFIEMQVSVYAQSGFSKDIVMKDIRIDLAHARQAGYIKQSAIERWEKYNKEVLINYAGHSELPALAVNIAAAAIEELRQEIKALLEAKND